MSTPKGTGMLEVGHSFDRIVVERREYIGEVVPSKTSETPMVVAAFEMAGRYINDWAAGDEDGTPMRLQFEYGGRTFVATMEPKD